MTSPTRSASGWSRAAWLCVLGLALPGQAQITISAARDIDDVAKAPAGVVPKGLAMYSVGVCNRDSAPVTIYEDMAVDELRRAGYAVQGGDEVLYAAANHKAGALKVTLLGVAELAAPIAFGFAAGRAGTATSRILAGAGGATVLGERITRRKEAAAKLDIPKGWWTPGGGPVTLQPGQCHPMTVTIAGKKLPETIKAQLEIKARLPGLASHERTPDSTMAALQINDLPAGYWVSFSPRSHERHIEDPLEEVRAALEASPSPETERAWRERIAQIGAGQ